MPKNDNTNMTTMRSMMALSIVLSISHTKPMNRKRTGRTMKISRTDAQADGERAALLHLKRVHPELFEAARPHKGAILSRIQPKRTNAALFERLATSIVSQQLSTMAAASIFARLKETVGGTVTPTAVLGISPVRLRSAGLSEAKVKSLRELAKAVDRKKLNLLSLKRVPPGEAIEQLTAIHGIGPWTAEMFLIFALGAPDIFSPGDLILARRMQKIMNLPKTVSKKEMAELAERWSPHRSFVSLLFWKMHHAELEAPKRRP